MTDSHTVKICIMITILNIIAMISLSRLKETFGKGLNYFGSE
jgi:hypothetical protein